VRGGASMQLEPWNAVSVVRKWLACETRCVFGDC